MIGYVIGEINGKQYKFVPGKPLEVDLVKKELAFKPLMVVDGRKIKLGKPYLEKKFKVKILDSYGSQKIRVAKYHAKANYRRVRGSRIKVTKVVLEA